MNLNTQKISSHSKPKCLVCRKMIIATANLQFPCFIGCKPSTRLSQSTWLWVAHSSPRPAGFRRPHVLLQWCELKNEGSGGMWQIRSEEGGRAETGSRSMKGGKKNMSSRALQNIYSKISWIQMRFEKLLQKGRTYNILYTSYVRFPLSK